MYGYVRYLLPDDTPTPIVNYVRLKHYVDSNLFHYQLTGHSVTCILQFINKNPVGWYYKKQSNVDTDIDGSGFVSSCTCAETMIYLSNTLR